MLCSRPGALAKLEEQNCEVEEVASKATKSNIREYVYDAYAVLKEVQTLRRLSQEGVNAPSYRSS